MHIKIFAIYVQIIYATDGGIHYMSTNVTIRMDEKIKEQADRLYDTLGMSLSTAINIFIKQSIREQRIPFEITAETPNSKTIRAMNEIEEIRNNKRKVKNSAMQKNF